MGLLLVRFNPHLELVLEVTSVNEELEKQAKEFQSTPRVGARGDFDDCISLLV